MDKRYLYQIWKGVRPVRPWYFLVLAVLFGALSVVALRDNNLHMAQLRAAVYDADKNNGNVQQALQNLQMYVTNHMNTDLAGGPNAPYPPVQLVYTYDRAVLKAGEDAAAFNSRIYTDAQKYCEQNGPSGFYGAYRVPCVQQYIHNHGVTDVPTVPDALYKFAFLSPRWSPDLAGWSSLLAGASLLAFAVSWLAHWWLRATTR